MYCRNLAACFSVSVLYNYNNMVSGNTVRHAGATLSILIVVDAGQENTWQNDDDADGWTGATTI